MPSEAVAFRPSPRSLATTSFEVDIDVGAGVDADVTSMFSGREPQKSVASLTDSHKEPKGAHGELLTIHNAMGKRPSAIWRSTCF